MVRSHPCSGLLTDCWSVLGNIGEWAFHSTQSFYEKSRIHYLLPILVLVIYSFLGGAIFYTIEVSLEEIISIINFVKSPAEQSILLKKKEYVDREGTLVNKSFPLTKPQNVIFWPKCSPWTSDSAKCATFTMPAICAMPKSHRRRRRASPR